MEIQQAKRLPSPPPRVSVSQYKAPLDKDTMLSSRAIDGALPGSTRPSNEPIVTSAIGYNPTTETASVVDKGPILVTPAANTSYNRVLLAPTPAVSLLTTTNANAVSDLHSQQQDLRSEVDSLYDE
jgi:hypothetical protein